MRRAVGGTVRFLAPHTSSNTSQRRIDRLWCNIEIREARSVPPTPQYQGKMNLRRSIAVPVVVHSITTAMELCQTKVNLLLPLRALSHGLVPIPGAVMRARCMQCAPSVTKSITGTMDGDSDTPTLRLMMMVMTKAMDFKHFSRYR